MLKYISKNDQYRKESIDIHTVAFVLDEWFRKEANYLWIDYRNGTYINQKALWHHPWLIYEAHCYADFVKEDGSLIKDYLNNRFRYEGSYPAVYLCTVCAEFNRFRDLIESSKISFRNDIRSRGNKLDIIYYIASCKTNKLSKQEIEDNWGSFRIGKLRERMRFAGQVEYIAISIHKVIKQIRINRNIPLTIHDQTFRNSASFSELIDLNTPFEV